MIQELKAKNFLSFKDEAILSFEATRDRALEENYVVEVAPGVRLLRFAMVMGANASGKSNLLEALEFLRHWWFDKPEKADEPTGVEPFLLDSESALQPSELELRFWTGGVKYCYQLCLDSRQVYREVLNVYRSVQPTNVFTRELRDGLSVVTFNPAVDKLSDVAAERIQLECWRNMSVIAAREQLNIALGVTDQVRDWMRIAINPIIRPEMRMYEWAIEEMVQDEKLKEHILRFMHTSDFNITDIQSREQVTELPANLIDMLLNSPNVPKEERDRIRTEHTVSTIDINFKHQVVNRRGVEEYTMPDSVQSYGTRRVIGMESAIYSATRQGSFLNIDELEASMHHDLVLYILGKYLSQSGESQMLVTTHCTPLLGWIDKLIRKDSVWFTERDRDGNSKLYTLVEFKGLNRMSSIQNAYLAGKFGAVPNITISNNYHHQNLPS